MDKFLLQCVFFPNPFGPFLLPALMSGDRRFTSLQGTMCTPPAPTQKGPGKEHWRRRSGRTRKCKKAEKRQLQKEERRVAKEERLAQASGRSRKGARMCDDRLGQWTDGPPTDWTTDGPQRAHLPADSKEKGRSKTWEDTVDWTQRSVCLSTTAHFRPSSCFNLTPWLNPSPPSLPIRSLLWPNDLLTDQPTPSTSNHSPPAW
jgi:hypothetical protein